MQVVKGKVGRGFSSRGLVYVSVLCCEGKGCGEVLGVTREYVLSGRGVL